MTILYGDILKLFLEQTPLSKRYINSLYQSTVENETFKLKH